MQLSAKIVLQKLEYPKQIALYQEFKETFLPPHVECSNISWQLLFGHRPVLQGMKVYAVAWRAILHKTAGGFQLTIKRLIYHKCLQMHLEN